MKRREVVVEIRILARQGLGVREIARQLDVSRNTVRKYLREEGLPEAKPRKPKAEKLGPYKDYLQQRVESARPLKLPATVLMEEIRSQGYEGGFTRLREFLAGLRKEAMKPEALIRFETAPGEQMQADWIVFRRGGDPLSAFVATLGASRASYVEFVTDEKLETLLRCHENAFDYFGGITREILYDNMKTVVLERNAYGEGHHRFHPTFLDFAQHHGFSPRLCKPYRAKTKGKVERFNGYLRRSFYNPLASRLSMEGLKLDIDTANAEVRYWLRNVANARIHGTTGRVPLQQLQEEQATLIPLQTYWRGTLPRQVQTISPPSHKKPAPEAAPLAFYDAQPFQHRLRTYDELYGEMQ